MFQVIQKNITTRGGSRQHVKKKFQLLKNKGLCGKDDDY
jgi:hypothetical protein